MNLASDSEPCKTVRTIDTPQNHARKKKIAFFGVFGIENLGNECTLQAILADARRLLPDTDFIAISYDPEDTSRRHHLPAYAVSKQHFQGISKKATDLWRVLSRALRLLHRLPAECSDWIHAVRTLRGTDVMIMTGTGMLTDYATSSTGFPYAVFRWSVAARLAGCKVRFVGVGVGPIYEKLSRWFIRTALSLADYRSFRDHNSRERIKNIGFDSGNDPIFPDLVFCLPNETFPKRKIRNTREVGLGVMDHRDVHLWTAAEHEARYSHYLETMCDFVIWLLDKSYTVRILQGDSRHDAGTRAELKRRLEKRGVCYDQAPIIDESSVTVNQLIDQIAQVDFVVSPRFHNLLLALMMQIPAVSISYDPKNDCLLDGMGLQNFHQSLLELDLHRLINQFIAIESQATEIKPLIEQRAREYRNLLEKQSEIIFHDVILRSGFAST